jgi:hypothetical protein
MTDKKEQLPAKKEQLPAARKEELPVLLNKLDQE